MQYSRKLMPDVEQGRRTVAEESTPDLLTLVHHYLKFLPEIFLEGGYLPRQSRTFSEK
jgi:hypothetical protein